MIWLKKNWLSLIIIGLLLIIIYLLLNMQSRVIQIDAQTAGLSNSIFGLWEHIDKLLVDKNLTR